MAVVYGVLGPGRHPHGRHLRHHQRVALVQRRHRAAVRRARRWRCSTSSRSTSRGSRARFQVADAKPRHVPARLHARRARGAARRRVRRAGRHPGRAVRERPVCDRARRSRWRCRSCLGLGMALPWPDRRRRHRGAAEAGRRGWSASSRRSASSSWHGGVLRLPRVRAAVAIAGSMPPRSQASVDEKLKEGWYSTLDRGPCRRRARAEAGAHRFLGHLVQELPDHGQDDAGGSRGRRRRWRAT